MNSRKYGFQEVVERSEEPITYYSKEYGKIMIGIIIFGLLVILWVANVIKQDSILNWQQIERTENYKIEQIQLDRLFRDR